MNYVPMQKASQTGINVGIPIRDWHQIFIQHRHGGYMSTELRVMCMRQRRTSIQ